jgi:hypothetical protein
VLKQIQKPFFLKKADLPAKQSAYASHAMFAENALNMPSNTMSALASGVAFLSVNAAALSAAQRKAAPLVKFFVLVGALAPLSIGSLNGR